MTDPKPLLDINEGSRPSQLTLDLEALGEQKIGEGGEEARQRHRDALAAARREVAPFDAAALRARAKPAEVVSLSRWRSRRYALVGGLAAMAAATLLMVQPGEPQPDVRAKGGPQLGWMVLHDGEVRIGDGNTAVHPGDRIQFTWAGDADDMVLVGADGSRELRVLWPSDPSAGPVPLDGDSGMLDGSVELDEAPGPELFVAVFNPDSVDAAVKQVSAALGDGRSADDLVDWGDSRRDVDVLLIPKAPSN